MKFLQISIQIMQLALAGMLTLFLYMQYRARGRGTEIVRRLRRHIVIETIAMLMAFIVAAFTSHDGYGTTVAGHVIALIVTIFLFVAFLSGTKVFFDITSGKYDDQLK